MKTLHFIFLVVVVVVLLSNHNRGVFGAYNDPTCKTSNNPCARLNGLLAPCGATFTPPSSSSVSQTFGITDSSFASCACNQNFYDTLTNCYSCYATDTNNLEPVPLAVYRNECTAYGVTWNSPPPTSSSSSPSSTSSSSPSSSSGGGNKTIIIVVVVVVCAVVLLAGVAFWRIYYSNKKRKEQQNAQFSDTPPDPPTTHIMDEARFPQAPSSIGHQSTPTTPLIVPATVPDEHLPSVMDEHFPSRQTPVIDSAYYPPPNTPPPPQPSPQGQTTYAPPYAPPGSPLQEQQYYNSMVPTSGNPPPPRQGPYY